MVISRDEIQPGDIWLLRASELTDDLLLEAAQLRAGGLLAVGRPPARKLVYPVGLAVAIINREENDLRWVQK